jgi:sodium pump decarboxylase gamma subunit
MPAQSTLAAQQADTLQAWGRTGMDSIIAGDGIMIAIVGVIIVFTSLTIISLLIRVLKKLASQQRSRAADTASDDGVPVRNGVSGEVVAAIATALQHHLFEVHDEERTIITIKKVSRPYSPWSSKLYGMTPTPFNTVSKR